MTPTSLGFTHRGSEADRVDQGRGHGRRAGPRGPWAPQDPAVLEAIADAAADGARMVSLCAGAFVLGQAGVLDGRTVTTHWALADEFRAAFPRVTLVEHAHVRRRRPVLSSGGMLASADLCLYVLSQDHGQSYANDVSRVLISPPHRSGGQAQYAKPLAAAELGSAGTGAGVAGRAPGGPAHLARRRRARPHEPADAGRRFRAETGESLAGWIARRRVERARALLEDSELTVSAVAHTVGFGSTEAMRRHFVARRGPRPGPIGRPSAAPSSHPPSPRSRR